MSAIVALEAARAAGIRLATDGDDLLLEANAAPPSSVLDLLSLHKLRVVELLRNQITTAREIDQAEREAIVIREDKTRTLAIPLGAVPAIYADALAELLARASADVPTERWHRCIRDAVEFLDVWGEAAAPLGWTADDLFGLNRHVGLNRHDQAGLCWLLKGERVMALTATEARLSGGLAYYRNRPCPRQGSREVKDQPQTGAPAPSGRACVGLCMTKKGRRT
jgi:hypothetical protein